MATTDTPDGIVQHLSELRNHFQKWQQPDLARIVGAILVAYEAQRDRIEALERRVDALTDAPEEVD